MNAKHENAGSIVTFATMGPSVTWAAITLESFGVDVTHLQAFSAVQAFLTATTAVVAMPAFQTWLQDFRKTKLGIKNNGQSTFRKDV